MKFTILTVRLFLATLAVGLAYFALSILTKNEVPVSNRDALMVALGVVLGLSKDVYGFFFSSTHGSEEKTHIISDSKKLINPPNEDNLIIDATYDEIKKEE